MKVSNCSPLSRHEFYEMIDHSQNRWGKVFVHADKFIKKTLNILFLPFAEQHCFVIETPVYRCISSQNVPLSEVKKITHWGQYLQCGDLLTLNTYLNPKGKRDLKWKTWINVFSRWDIENLRWNPKSPKILGFLQKWFSKGWIALMVLISFLLP